MAAVTVFLTASNREAYPAWQVSAFVKRRQGPKRSLHVWSHGQVEGKRTSLGAKFDVNEGGEGGHRNVLLVVLRETV